jgi:hypothetical protein
MKNRIDLRAGALVPDFGGQTSTEWTARTECGNPSCSGRWLSLLKDRRRPMFEGKWGCSSNCIKTLVSSAIRREAAEEGAPMGESTHRHRLPLGLILLERGWISPEQLAHALDLQQREKTGRIGEWLIAECGVSKDRVTRALAMQWGCPALTLEGFNAKAMALAVPRSLMEAHGILPLRISAGRALYFGFAHRPDASAALAMERMSGLKVESGLVELADWTAARDELRKCDFVNETLEQAIDTKDLTRKVSSMLVGLQPRASRLVRVHEFYWLRLWLEAGAMSNPNGGIPWVREDVLDRIYRVGAQQ